MSKVNLAVKHDEELAKMEAELVAQASEEIEETPQVQEEETTSVEESAPSKEETPEEESEGPVEAEASTTEHEGFTEEEWNALSDKTRVEMTKLREKARKADELEKEATRADVMAKVYAPLQEVSHDIREESYKPESGLPWEDSPTQKAGHWASTLMEDISYSEGAYPELNPDSPDYNDDLTGEILQDYRSMRQSNPDLRLKNMVDRRMRSIKSAKEQALKKIEAEREARKQKSQEALPATATSTPKKITLEDKISQASSFEDLDRLEREIGTSKRFK